ncbi:MAG: hypothetical protein AAF557_04860 [Pseudomonadota bacterium]
MKFLIPFTVASATAIGALTAPAMAQAPSDAASLYALLQRLGGHYALIVLRTFVDVTYDQLTVEPGTNQLVITGMTLYPELPYDPDALCEVTIDRASSGDVLSFETVQTTYEFSGVSATPACFDPDVAGMLGSFGYDGLTAENVSLSVGYNLPDSSADVTINASVADAADVSISAAFSYLWFRVPFDGGDEPVPVAQLSEAEISIENKGVFERVEPMIAAQIGDLNAVPQMAQAIVGQAFTEGGTRQPTPDESAFVESLSAELARFLAEKNRIVVTAAPEEGVWLDESIFDSPSNMVAALKPNVSSTPNALRAIIPPAEMASALADGANPDDAARMKIGRALLTGIGAPRSIEDGGQLLIPLARNWNGEAAALVAGAAGDFGEHKIGYEMALIAMAQGESSAMSAADNLELDLSLEEALAIQKEVSNAWPGGTDTEAQFNQAIADGDITTLRKLANAASVGRNMPRDYEVAYALATLGAAAGDRAAASLRDRMDRRFNALDQATWQKTASRAASDALRVWTEGGLGATMAARVQ